MLAGQYAAICFYDAGDHEHLAASPFPTQTCSARAEEITWHHGLGGNAAQALPYSMSDDEDLPQKKNEKLQKLTPQGNLQVHILFAALAGSSKAFQHRNFGKRCWS